MIHALRSATRHLLQRPGVTLVAAVLLAMGIGFYVTAARFLQAETQRASSVDPRGLMMLQGASQHAFGPMRLKASDLEGLSLPGLMDLCRLRPDGVRLHLPQGGSERLQVQQADAGYFALTGVKPALGRPMIARDCEPGAPPVVLLSFGLWQRVYGGRLDVIGTRILMNGIEREVVGVLPRGHAFTPVSGMVSMLLPLDATASEGLFLLGRRDAAAPSGPLDAALRIHSEVLAPRYAKVPGWHLALHRPPNFSETPLWVHGLNLAAPAVILLLACAGVGSLMMAQGMARQREDALRAALGATARGMMARPLAEAFLLSFAGGVGGLGVAWVLLRVLWLRLPSSAATEQLHVDGVSFLMALLATGLCVMLCAVGPTWRAFRLDLLPLMRDAGGMTGRPKGLGIRRGLVALQVGMTTMLLILGAQVLHHGWRSLHRTTGLITRDAVLTEVALREGETQRGPALARLAEDLRASLGSLPGVTAVGVGSADPWVPNNPLEKVRRADGRECAVWNNVVLGPGWPEAHGLCFLQGRDLTRGEAGCLVNETFVRSHGITLGESLRFEGGETRQVVGVVSDHVRDQRARPNPEVFYSPDKDLSSIRLTVRGAVSSEALRPAVLRALKELPAWVEAGPVTSLEALRRDAAADLFQMAMLLGTLALLGLGLALGNLYALMATLVNLKAAVFALATALGRTPLGVVRDVLADGLRLALWGLLPGALAGIGLTGLLSKQIYGLPPFDLPVIVAVLSLMLLASLGATLGPALAAARRNPMEALKTL